MAYVGVLVIAAINCGILLFAALLGVGGDGSSDGVRSIWLFGYIWIALLTSTALFLCARQKGASAVVVAVATLPAAYIASVVAIVFGAGFAVFKPASSEFIAVCKNSGVQFFASPREPVRSLAYEWGRQYPVDINYFQISANNYATAIQTRNQPYPLGIVLVDDQLKKADVIVSFNYPIGKDELSKVTNQQGLVGYEITVIDKRDNRSLAKLTYFTDLSNQRVCGPTIDGVLSVGAFVTEAIGVK